MSSININVGLLITGNEVLSAKVKDTNGPFIGMHLRKIGVPIKSSMMCADNEADILDCLEYLSRRCNAIFMTGGLGPTTDDLTAAVVAKFFGVNTIFFDEAWENCLEAYKKFNKTNVPDSNKKQAYLPEGSVILPNKIGTAVGFKATGKKHNKMVSVFCMPGVPYEMEAMFLKEIYPELSSLSIPPLIKTWQVFYLGESAMQTSIEEHEKKLQTKFPTAAISYQAHAGFVTYSVSLFPRTQEQKLESQKFLEDEFIPAVQKSFHKHILYSDETPLNQYIIDALKQKRKTLAFVEASCGGMLTHQVSTVKNAEDVMNGTVILQGKKDKRVQLSSALWDDMAQIKKLEFMKADICITEWGAPALEMATEDVPHGHFNIIFSINKQKIKDDIEMQTRLEGFAWKREVELETPERVNYSCELNVSTRYGKEAQQTRVALHCLCSLALIVNYL
ncbi:MAG: molybdopterin-binding protein [Bdellovibrionota bacterium]